MEKRGGKGGRGRREGTGDPLSEILNTSLCPPHCFRPGDAPVYTDPHLSSRQKVLNPFQQFTS